MTNPQTILIDELVERKMSESEKENDYFYAWTTTMICFIGLGFLFFMMNAELDKFKEKCISHGYCYHAPSDGHLVWQNGTDAP